MEIKLMQGDDGHPAIRFYGFKPDDLKSLGVGENYCGIAVKTFCPTENGIPPAMALLEIWEKAEKIISAHEVNIRIARNAADRQYNLAKAALGK